MKKISLVLALAVSVISYLPADDEGHGNERHHHEDLTEAQLGTVHFPSSCSAAMQKPVERGVAMLHSFWYEEAEKEFEQIEKDDSQCAIAHWGLAMSLWHQLWNRPELAVLQRGGEQLKRAEHMQATAREKDYIKALAAFYFHPERPYEKRATAYSNAMQKVMQRNPDDHEAAAFYALSLLAADDDKTNDNRKKAAAVLEKLFAEEPNHPGVAHYLIHTYDKPDMAKQGLPAARRYAQIAPAAPHALHMPAHIFARLGLWQDDIDSNVRSVQATQKEAAMHMGGEGHQFHAMDFLVYAYLQTGREQDAQKIIDEVKAMPQMHAMYGLGFDPHLAALGGFQADYALELHHWADAAALAPIDGAPDLNHSMTYLARAVGAARSGNAEQAKKEVAQLESLQKKMEPNRKKEPWDYDGVSNDLTVARAWLTYTEGHPDQAISALRPLADKARGEAQASEGIPVHEMIADMLLEAKRPAEALSEYEATLQSDPGRFNALYGAAQAAEQVGQNDKASKYYAELVKNCDGSKSDRAELKHARERVEARAMAQLRSPSLLASEFLLPQEMMRFITGHKKGVPDFYNPLRPAALLKVVSG
jgi:tetratricopeptide (TPR) repeat protein